MIRLGTNKDIAKILELGNITYESKEKLDKTPKTVIDFLKGE